MGCFFAMGCRQTGHFLRHIFGTLTSASDCRFRHSTRRLRQQGFVCRCARTTSARLSQGTGETQESTLWSPEQRDVVQDVVQPCEETRNDGWIACRIWSHRDKHWRKAGWKRLPKRVLYREPGLVTLVGPIPSLASHASS